MNIGDWVNVCLCVLSFILAAISVVTVIITLKQNSKMIEEGNRPYISVYGDETNFSSPQFYIVIKNFGKTGAVIKSIKCDVDLSKYSFDLQVIPFQHLEGTMLAPGQNFVCNLDNRQLSADNICIIHFKVEYCYRNKVYEENYPVNYQALCKNIKVKTSTQNKELQTISYVLQEMVQKNL